MSKYIHPLLIALVLASPASAGTMLFKFENRANVSEDHLLRFGYHIGVDIEAPLDEDVEIPAPITLMPAIREELASQHARFWFAHPAAPGVAYEFATMGDLCAPSFCAIPNTTVPSTQWHVDQVTHELYLANFQDQIWYIQTVRIYGAIPEPAAMQLIVTSCLLLLSLRRGRP